MSAKKKSDFVNVGDVIIKYTRYWKWFLLSGIACVLVAVAYLKTVDPTYLIVSNVKLKSEAEGAKIASSLVRSFGLGSLADSDNIDDEAAVMASQSHMRDMIYSLGLYTTYDLKKFPFDKSLYNSAPLAMSVARSVMDTLSMPIEFKINVKGKSIEVKTEIDGDKVGEENFDSLPAEVKTPYGNFVLNYSGKTIDADNYQLNIAVLGLDYAAERFRNRIMIGAASNTSDIISLSVQDVNRNRGKDILNKLVELYNEDAKVDKNSEAENTASFIKERIDLLAVELSDLERYLEKFKKENNITDLSSESSSVFLEKYNELQEMNAEIGVQLSVADMLENFINDPKHKYELIPTNTGVSSNALEAIRGYNSVVLERNHLLQNSTEQNPVVISKNEDLALLRKNVEISIRNARKDISLRKKNWAGLEGEMQSKLSEMPRQEREYLEIERQRKVKSDLYVFLLTKMEETQLTLASTTPRAKVIDGAYNIWKPVSPRKMVTLGIALLFALMIPVLIIYILEIFKTKIASKEELIEATSVPVLGEISLDRNANNVAVAEGVTTSTAELFRLVRTNLQFLMKKGDQVILVTSSVSGEGKSFFTVNLALSFSLIKNKKVVLVGLDIRNPKLSEYLSIDRKDGMTLYLASDNMKPEDIIIHRPDLHPNVYVIPAGPIPPNPSELLLNDRLEEMFDYLRANFDYIIVDTAPVGMVSDTFSLDRISDTTVYLFRANYTNKSYLKFAEAIVDEQKLKKMSIVINGTTTKAAYGYGYGAVTENRNR